MRYDSKFENKIATGYQYTSFLSDMTAHHFPVTFINPFMRRKILLSIYQNFLMPPYTVKNKL